MTAQTILPANSVTGSYDVDNSLRFNFASSDYLNLTAAGNSTLSTKGTWSTWVKKSNPGSSRGPLFSGYADADNRVYLVINADAIVVFGKVGGTVRYTAQVDQLNRDPSAWMNIVVAIDTTQGTNTNRIKIYINGIAATIGSVNGPVWPVQDSAIPYAATNSYTNLVGALYSTSLSQYLDGYLAETVFVDGLALDQNSFGEFDSDSDIWKPKNVSGLTFGDNGFYLEYKGSGTSANSSGLGADTSGNDSHFTVNNLTAVDQSTDTCTNNFATFNPLFPNTFTFSEGNCIVNADAGSAHQLILSTIAPANGVWYAEFKITDLGGDYAQIGIRDVDQFVTAQYVGQGTRGYGYAQHGTVAASGSNVATGQTSISANDIIGVWMDLDNQVLKWYINDTLRYTYSSVAATYSYAFAVSIASSTSGQWEGNFGGSPGFAISSGNQDPNGYGNFEFATKSGYALCSKNLAEYG